MRLGVFGGTFDPPHIGHLILADEALNQIHLDRILWLVTPMPPHKEPESVSSIEDRLVLIRACIAGNPKFEISTVDIERRPPHFAVDSMRIIRHQNPHSKLVYLMGADSLEDLTNWHDPEGFVEACDEICVMHRQSDPVDLKRIEIALPGVLSIITFLDVPLVDISSSMIRHRIAVGGVFRYYLPKNVYQLILEMGMYR